MLLGTDVSGMDLDGPLHGPVPDMGDTNGPLSRQRLLLEAARRDNLTLWELCLLNAGPRGHLLTVGTPSQIVDIMEHWFRNEAADGFNVMPAWLPGSLDDFVNMVIPELQRRGLFRRSMRAMVPCVAASACLAATFHSRGAYARENGTFIGGPRS